MGVGSMIGLVGAGYRACPILLIAKGNHGGIAPTMRDADLCPTLQAPPLESATRLIGQSLPLGANQVPRDVWLMILPVRSDI